MYKITWELKLHFFVKYYVFDSEKLNEIEIDMCRME